AADAALDAILEALVELLGPGALLEVCRCWFTATVCNHQSFRGPLNRWQLLACSTLDEQLLQMAEPPEDDFVEDLRIGLEHAEAELRLTQLSASFPSGVTVVLLRYARRLSSLLCWINLSLQPRSGVTGEGGLRRQQNLWREIEELHRRARQLAEVSAVLRGRLPDPELPMRWAQWFEDIGEVAGLPADHCKRYRTQREQVAAVWANNRRTFLCTDEHVDALLHSLVDLEEIVRSAVANESKQSQ
ncbi:unnamed protein product, partial [Polarella glacialis]